MKTQHILLYCFVFGAAAVMPACKAKKMVAKQPEQVAPPVATAAPVTPAPAPKPMAAAPAPVAPPKVDLNFSNVQFDFNSAILRTSAIEYLDHIAMEMKQSPNKRFEIDGFASAEGTAEHNMVLSADRANSVKVYLANSGVDASRLSTKGFGEAKPIASNDTESGREQNRRVEVKLSNN